MYKHAILFVVALLCFVQCQPVDVLTHQESSSSSQLHLFMNNSTHSSNYHLTPLWDAMEDIDEVIDKQLHAVLPFLNFFFDSLLGPTPANDDDDCKNSMIIQLVPENPQHQPDKVEPNSEHKTEEKSAPSNVEKSDQTVVTVVKNNDVKQPDKEVKTEDKPKDKSETTPEVVTTTNAPPTENTKPTSAAN